LSIKFKIFKSMKNFLKICIFLTILICKINSKQNTHYAFDNDKDLMVFKWEIIGDEILMTLETKATGWISVGLSKQGFMRNSDIYFGYIDENAEMIVKDMWAFDYVSPREDKIDNIINFSGSKNADGGLSMTFRRKLNTGDNEEDMQIAKGEQLSVLFAYKNGNSYLSRHDEMTSALLVLNPNTNQDVQWLNNSYVNDDSILKMRVAIKSKVVPRKKATNYYCQYFNIKKAISEVTKLPEDTSYHALAFHAFNDNPEILHHTLIYFCDARLVPMISSQEGFDEDSFDCHGSMPPGCYEPLAIYAVGGNDVVFPPEAGPMWGTNASQIVMLENHYEIPIKLLEENSNVDIVDRSGYDVYFTNNLRQYDVGLIMYGPELYSIKIPAKNNNFLIQDYCPSTCTEKYMSDQGINAFAYALHGHSVLRDITQSVIYPDGTEESFDYNHYDFNKQKLFYYNTHKKFTKNDKMKLNCYYNTMGKSDVTLGGDGTKEEMCFSFIYYYPYENGHSSCSATYDGDGCEGLKKNVRVVSDKPLNRQTMKFKGLYSTENQKDSIVTDSDKSKNFNLINSSFLMISYSVICLILLIF
jgi:hypothetical protein